MNKVIGVVVAFVFGAVAFAGGVALGVKAQERKDHTYLQAVKDKLAEMPKEGFVPFGNANSGLWVSSAPNGAVVAVVFRDGFAVSASIALPGASSSDDTAFHDGERSEARAEIPQADLVRDCEQKPKGDLVCS